ncbi:MAG: DUF4091 domain-containing protein [Planctomycetes bacterium]|nr:DUF4091 domain-containing protein [Planctomycetota bacterium]
MKSNSIYALVAVLSLVMNAHAEWHVWTVTETRHVLRSDPPGHDRAVEVGAAQNEWVSFQVLLRCDEPVKAVRLEADELRGPGGATLPMSESRCYRQHQLHLETGTYRNRAFKPDGYPDPLIPFHHPLTGDTLGSARLVAVPFDLRADETHGFWVDLHVPATTSPGDYRGVYRLTSGNYSQVEIPVTLRVWDFALAPTPTLVTAFGSPAQRMRGYYRDKAGGEAPADWQAVETQCAQLLSEHRINATPPTELLRPVRQDDGSFRIPSQQVQALRAFVDRYHVNALQVPHPSAVVKDPEEERETLRAWLAAFDRAAKELARPHVVFFIYLKDEPNTEEDYRYVQQWGRAIREIKSVVHVMVVEQTWTEPGKGGADSAWGDLYGAVDIWCPLFSLHRPDSAAKRRALGETIWTYTALCQGTPTPWWHIDYPLLNYRAPAWMAWRDGIQGLLYWGGMSHWRQTEDPWTHVPIYIGQGALQQGRRDVLFNGEGSLVYPARAVGYDGIVPTIRLKALRDAIEDYEYLALLNRLGKSAEAAQIVRRLTDSWFQWDKDPVAYEKARAELAAMIEAVVEPRPQPSAGPANSGRVPLRLHPDNPRYFQFRQEPTVLITSGEHYGALINLDFDYVAYLDELARYSFNHTRLFSGTYREVPGAFGIQGNTLAPAPQRYAAPWARSDTPGYFNGGNKFDLTQWDDGYFQRLKDFVEQAGQRGIVVEVTLFCTMYSEELWRASPMHPANNVNEIGDVGRYEVYALKDDTLTEAQAAVTRKIVHELNPFDNVYYEICNEPYERGGMHSDWQDRIIAAIRDAEESLPNRHLISLNVAHGSAEITQPRPDVSIYNFHAGRPEAVTLNYDLAKVIGDNETGGSQRDDATYRMQGWEFILAGGALFSHLDFSFATNHPRGRLTEHRGPGGGGPALRRQLQVLKEFIHSFDFVKMRPDNSVIRDGVPEKGRAWVLVEPGRAYAIYLGGSGPIELTLELPEGTYRAEWINTPSGSLDKEESFAHGGGPKRLQSPDFAQDIALRVKTK